MANYIFIRQNLNLSKENSVSLTETLKLEKPVTGIYSDLLVTKDRLLLNYIINNIDVEYSESSWSEFSHEFLTEMKEHLETDLKKIHDVVEKYNNPKDDCGLETIELPNIMTTINFNNFDYVDSNIDASNIDSSLSYAKEYIESLQSYLEVTNYMIAELEKSRTDGSFTFFQFSF